MLSQYSWGDFALFVLVVVVLYYAAVGFLYYRQELGAFFTRKGRGGAQLAGAGTGPGAAAAAPSLVRTTSAFAGATTPATAAQAPGETPAAVAGAAQNLSAGEEVAAVTGSQPASTAAATGQDEGPAPAGPMDSAGGVEAAADLAAEYDEQRTEHLDEVDEDLIVRARQLAAEMPNEEIEKRLDELIEKNNNDEVNIENISTFSHVEPVGALEPGLAAYDHLLYSFEAPIASAADVVPVAAERLSAVSSVVEFIAQAQAGNRPAVPAAIQDTSLASLVAERVAASHEELNSLFDAGA